MTQTEALKLALAVLKEWRKGFPDDWTDFDTEAVTAIKEALAQPEQDWRNAAIRVGEDLSSVGPDGYYDMTAQQWLDWAMEQQPRGKNSLAQPEFVATSDTSEKRVDETAKQRHEQEAQIVRWNCPCGNEITFRGFTQAPQRKPLTDEELYKVFPAIATYHEANKTLYQSIARAIEAAHGIKGEA